MDLCGTHRGPVWDASWTCFGRIMDLCGTHRGPVWDASWTCVGRIVDLCGTHHGPVWDASWTCVGCIVDLCGTHRGPVWDASWTCVGRIVDLCVTHCGPLRDASWTGTRPRRSGTFAPPHPRVQAPWCLHLPHLCPPPPLYAGPVIGMFGAYVTYKLRNRAHVGFGQHDMM